MELRHRAKVPCGLSGFEPHETWFRKHLSYDSNHSTGSHDTQPHYSPKEVV